jgi:hypothetical protein
MHSVFSSTYVINIRKTNDMYYTDTHKDEAKLRPTQSDVLVTDVMLGGLGLHLQG